MEDKQTFLEEVLISLNDDLASSEQIQDNKLLFEVDKVLYRVRMPNQRERTLATQKKNQLFWKFVKEGKTPLKKALIKSLKENLNVDIEALEDSLEKLSEEMTQIHLSLSTKKDTEKKAIIELKEKIDELKYQRKVVILEKAEHLSPCIEVQVEDDFYKVLTSFCTEKLIKDKVERYENVWNSYEEFENDTTKLPLLACANFTNLFFHC